MRPSSWLLVVAAVIVEAFWKLKLSYPKVDDAKRKELDLAREPLRSEKK